MGSNCFAATAARFPVFGAQAQTSGDMVHPVLQLVDAVLLVMAIEEATR